MLKKPHVMDLEACTQETAVWKSKSLSNYSVNAMKIKPKPLEMWICCCRHREFGGSGTGYAV